MVRPTTVGSAAYTRLPEAWLITAVTAVASPGPVGVRPMAALAPTTSKKFSRHHAFDLLRTRSAGQGEIEIDGGKARRTR